MKRDDRGWLHFSLEGGAFFCLSLSPSAVCGLPDASRLKLNMNRGKISGGASLRPLLLHIPAAAGDNPSVLPTPAEILLTPASPAEIQLAFVQKSHSPPISIRGVNLIPVAWSQRPQLGAQCSVLSTQCSVLSAQYSVHTRHAAAAAQCG